MTKKKYINMINKTLIETKIHEMQKYIILELYMTAVKT